MPVPLPEIIAHRGASRERPENTLAAFRRAVELGADAIELDLHRTSDGVIVVHHDADVGSGRAIRELTLATVGAVRVGGEPIPTLAQVFEAVGASLGVYCELKGLDTAPAALDVIQAFATLPAGAAVHAFDHRLIAEAARLAPSVPRGVLEVSYPVDPLGAARDVDARDLWRQWEFVDEALVRAAHADGRRVVAWTVNDAAAMSRLSMWGVDALCTDDVPLALRTLR